jgi:AraC-like DNA-binding protein
MHIANHAFQNSGIEFELRKFKNFVASNFFAADYETTADTTRYPASLGGFQFGSVAVFKYQGQGFHRGNRRLHHIRADHVDDFLISLPIRGKNTLLQLGTQIDIEPGNFIITSTSKPFVKSANSGHHQSGFQSYQVRVSGSMLRERVPRIDEYCHNRIMVVSGAGEIMASMLVLAMHEGHALTEAQSRSFGGMLVEAIVNAMRDAPELLMFQPESHQSSRARVREAAEHFIKANISNPTLDPVSIARHCKVSVRYLYAAFAECSQTPVSLIRESRLERCRAALQSPDLRNYSIFEIALRWGFNEQAHFSRVYKAKFGKTPRDDRTCK